MQKAASLNHVYRLVWNSVTQGWVVVSEITKSRGKRASGKLGAVVSVLLLASSPFLSYAEPTGGVVTAGSGTISQSGTTTTINQSSQTLNLNWNTFNVGSNETVNFIQPSATALAVNQILDTNGSRILGNINANGQVWLINPNGVYFGQGAEINVGSLLASTLNPLGTLTTNGTQVFGNGGTGSITNAGSIKAADGGYVALIANTVSNTGNIQANNGAVALGAGSQVSVTFADNQLLSLTVDKSTLNNLAENKGLIQADGGIALLSAGAKDSLLASMVNNEGVIEAKTVGHKEGKIILLGGMEAGRTKVAGTLDASAETGDGGFIETSAAKVQVADGTVVTTKANNTDGGDGQTGTWLIDPVDFTVAASGGDMTGSGVSAALANNNFQIMSTQGATGVNGDININDAISWSTNHSLTLTAQRNININQTITATGATAKLTLEYGQAKAFGIENTATYNINAKVNLQAGNNFSTKLGYVESFFDAGKNITEYKVITSLGAQGSTTGSDLQGIHGNLTGNYVLGADIDAGATSNWNDGAGFNPLGTATNPFNGKFDGLGHEISNLTTNRPLTLDVGLFGALNQQASIQNLGLVNANVTGVYHAGILAGVTSGSHIRNVYSSGWVTGRDYIGGLVGFNQGNIENAHSNVTVIGRGNFVGGLTGEHQLYTIKNSSAIGDVSGAGEYAGGLIGNNLGIVENSQASGNVIGKTYVGGLAGYNSDEIINSHADGDVLGETYVGGLVGESIDKINGSYATGNVNGQDFVGGLVGSNTSGLIDNTYASGNVTATGDYAGGLVGANFFRDINKSYASGAVTGSGDFVAGVAGINTGKISHVYATGKVTGGGDYVGGVVGSNIGSSRTYNIQTNPKKRPILVTEYNGIVSNAYATGNVTGIGVNTGGFAGFSDGQISNVYYTNTTGQAANGLGVEKTISQLASNLPSGFTNTLWANADGQTTPYLLSNSQLANSGAVYLASDSNAAQLFNVILNANQLQNIQNAASQNYLLGNDIQASATAGWNNGAGFDPIAHFSGLLDGLGYRITGLTVNRANTDFVGLMGQTDGATIRNLSLFDLSVTGRDFVGGLVGRMLNHSAVSNVIVDGDVDGHDYVGGVVGNSFGSHIENTYANVNVDATGRYIGGFVGLNDGNANITNAYATGSVNTTDGLVGGLVGANVNGSTIRQAYATGHVSGAHNTGGFVGQNLANIEHGYYADTTGQNDAGKGERKSIAQLATGLGNLGFDTTMWGNADNQTTPYLLSLGVLDAAGRAYLKDDASASTLYSVIINVEQLQAIDKALSGNFVLGNNIEAGVTAGWNNGAGFNPLGDTGTGQFTGTLNGLGFTLNNIYINRSHPIQIYFNELTDKEYVGLFESIGSTGRIDGLGMVGGEISGTGAAVGSIAAENHGTINRSYATTKVKGVNPYSNIVLGIGGLVGNNYGLIANSNASGAVSGGMYAGGLVGTDNKGTISNSYATGNVSSDNYFVGGLVGNAESSTIFNAYATGDVSGRSMVGGLVGRNDNSTIGNSFAIGKTTGMYRVGGLVGENFGAIVNSYATGTVDGQNSVGGLVGVLAGNQFFGSNGAISSAKQAQGSISNSYSSARVIVNQGDGSQSYLGTNYGSFLMSYDPQTFGGLVGVGSATVLNSFWNTELSGFNTSKAGLGLNTAQMQNVNTFANSGWNISNIGGDASIWRIYDGQTAPLLRSFLTQANLGTTVTTYNGSVQTANTTGLDVQHVQGNLAQGRNVGSYQSAIYSDQFGYDFLGGNLIINQKALTFSVDAFNKTYDGTTHATFILSSSDIVGGDKLSYSVSSAAFNDKNAGQNKTVTVSGITLSGDDAGNYALQNTSATDTANIDQKHLTVTAYAVNKTYDGTTSATVAGLTSDGVIDGDNVTLSSTSASFNDKNAGIGKIVNLQGVRLIGDDAGNYSVDNLAQATANIDQKSLTVVADASNKTYDGNNSASVKLTSLDMIDGDNLSYSNTSATFSDKHAGQNKTVTVNGITLSGDDANNYALQSTSATDTANIDQKSLTVVADAANKTYDGNNSASVILSSADMVSGDNLSYSNSSATFSDKHAGQNKTVTVNGITLSGTDANNYALQSTTATDTANIDQKSLTVVADAANKTYDGNSIASVTLSSADMVAGDNLSYSNTSATFSDKNAGQNKTVTVNGITLSGDDANNYALQSTTATDTANIDQKSLTVVADAANKTYDGNNSATVTLSSADMVSGDKLSYSNSSATFSDKNAGQNKTVTVNGITLSGDDANNYALQSTTATDTANIDQKSLTVVADAANKTYDGNNSASVKLTSLDMIDGDNLSYSNTSATFSDKNAGQNKTVTVNGITLSGDDANNYALQSTTATDTANIDQKSLTVTAGAANKTYDGNTTATITALSVDGVIGSDKVDVSGTGANFNDKNAGTDKTVTVQGVSLSGDDAGNYSVDSTATTTADISKKNLTVIADAQNKTYDGKTDATIVYTSADMIAGDKVGYQANATFADKHAGANKAVTIRDISLTGDDADNYTLQNTSAVDTATISKKALTVTADAENKTYDGTTAATVALSSADKVAGDDLGFNRTTAVFNNKNAGVNKTVTVSGITMSGTDAKNYTLVSTKATDTANVDKKVLTISGTTVNDKTYDGKTTATGTAGTLSGFVGTETLNVAIGSANFIDKNAGQDKAVTVNYKLTNGLNGGLASNYALASTSETADIYKAILTYVATATSTTSANMIAGRTPTVTGKITGFVTGDTLANSTTGILQWNIDGSPKAAGKYGIYGSGLSADNYDFVQAVTNSTALTVRVK